MDVLVLNLALMRRMDQSSGGGLGFFLILMIVGVVVFLVLRGRRDKTEVLGTPMRPMTSGPIEGHSFACPYPKCPSCGAAGDNMKHAWDGMRKVTWTCGYCGAVAGVQELKDEELPEAARRRLGLDEPPGMVPGQQGYYPPQQGGGVGGLLTGMMIGEMLSGGRERRDDGGWIAGGDQAGPQHDWGEQNAGGSGDWGDAGSADSGGGGSDWGDSGGGDSGSGSDF